MQINCLNNYLNKLKYLVKSSVLPHAILLSGDVKKAFSIAESFVEWLFYEDNCVTVKNHPDYWLINLGSEQEIKIEHIREFSYFVNTTPYLANRKVLLINNFQNINQQATNALLKILEEPPIATKLLFLLISSNAKILLPTILSRVLHINIGSNINQNDDYDKMGVLQDLYGVWVQGNNNFIEIANKWVKFDRQQLINCLWFIVTNAIKSEKDSLLFQIKQKISVNSLWQLLDGLNYVNKAVILKYQINWQLFLDNFIFIKFTGVNIYGR